MRTRRVPLLSQRQSKALELTREIVRLEDEIRPLHERLERLRREFATLVPRENEKSPDLLGDEAPDSASEELIVDATLGERILRILDADLTSTFDAETLRKMLSVPGQEPMKIGSVRGTLLRMESDDKIRRVHRGKYASLKSKEGIAANG